MPYYLESNDHAALEMHADEVASQLLAHVHTLQCECILEGGIYNARAMSPAAQVEHILQLQRLADTIAREQRRNSQRTVPRR